jgi:serine phosphatase RsbU (regulator of sigma subunit)
LLLAVVYAVWRYESEQRQRQSLLDEEFRNAQELQRVLVPQSLPEVDGFTVTSAYLPAQEVGGDFFQIIPLHEGGTLAVVGDVSGKGLRAAMTVSLIVGALRTLVRTTNDPAKVLDGLNEMLQGRLHGGFVTCVVLRLHEDGTCVIANAGHLAPFLNEQEIELPGALPLGLSIDATYTETPVTLSVEDRLTLYTDGLVEARNEQGELFGFARVAALLAQRPDASAAVEAAVRFGQDDDVTVVSLSHVGRRASRMQSRAGLVAAADGVTA